MAKPSIEKIVVHSKTANGAAFDWDISFTCVTSKGTRFPERKFFPAQTGAQVLAAVKALTNSYEASESAPPAVPVPEFPGRYDATKGGLTVLGPADYPVGETPSL